VTEINLEQVALAWRRTKIIATLGPASQSKAMIRRLLEAGVNVIRLNMSHGTHDEHRAHVNNVRAVAKSLGKPVAILMDLCGPKIRVGRLKDGAMLLEDGTTVHVTSRQVVGENGLIPSQYRNIHKDVKKGERVLLDDGNLELSVLSVKGSEVACRVIHGGLLKDNKGMNLPDSDLSTPAFTEKDKVDVQVALEMAADFVALSFVRSAKDIVRLTRFMKRHGEAIPVISKIERPEAVDNIEEILDESYGIMVARGDLGIELPAEKVPLIQNDLIKRARRKHVPVIVATQMLESMIVQSRPTRAEVGDVANAAQSSADAVMLSGETASGKFPVEAVQTMDRVLREIEHHQWREGRFGSPVFSNRRRTDFSIREGVAHAALEIARDLKLKAIVVPTRSGITAQVLAAHRPTAPTVGLCARPPLYRRLALHWGIIPVLGETEGQDWHVLCRKIEKQCNLTKSGYTVLVVAGFNDDPALNEPMLKVLVL
jgi:pyruvate kinase